jgi:hypothetical protein
MTDLFRHLPDEAMLDQEQLNALATDLELWETPGPAAVTMLRAELFTPVVWDPCCGIAALTREIERAGYKVAATDIHDWGHGERRDLDFLSPDAVEFRRTLPADFSIIMNPPFSRAVEFVEQADRLGARKIAVFQRQAWWEGIERVASFWEQRPPNRYYSFDGRVTCWLGTIPPAERIGGGATAHSWFIWERGQPRGTLSGHLKLSA